MQIHRLIQLVVLDGMEKTVLDERFEDSVRLVQRAFPRITSATVPNSYKSDMWHLAQDCLPHVLSLEKLYLNPKSGITLSKPSGFPQLLSDTSCYLIHGGDLVDAEKVVQRALARYRKCEKEDGFGFNQLSGKA
ncbi:hypothetical protein B0T25DRAFT_516316 [Lasiosphaeria hispida]|uniref:Uncharacterized protein n=1 Tax=Lasiosphaeria hispida TaxID=260671 RepID=A0AAJ0MFH5_9PEZI|nr:hypothetical protein B0T25DRAFT_516316 [Lasiosphaeria hispida]